VIAEHQILNSVVVKAEALRVYGKDLVCSTIGVFKKENAGTLSCTCSPHRWNQGLTGRPISLFFGGIVVERSRIQAIDRIT